jgi:hypothetical protein
MFTNIKIALAAALIIGTASASLAGSENTEDRGGFVTPGSMVGVNPVYHLDLFGSPERADKADKAYGYVGLQNAQSRKKDYNH